MSQSSGYTRVLNMLLVLNTPGFWIFRSSEYARVRQGSEYTWIIPEYTWICLNLPDFTFPHLFCNPFSTWTRRYLFERLQETRGYNLREHEAVSLKRQNLIFLIAAGSISFVFYFRLDIFASKIEICLGWGVWGLGTMNFDIAF